MRIRTIKPEFWQSETVASLPYEARLLFIGLWNLADDYGRFRAHPAIVRGQLFPFDENADVVAWLGLLARAGLVQLYEADGHRFGFLPGFAEHQKIDKRAATRIPDPPAGATTRKRRAPAPANIPPVPAEKVAGPAEDLAEPANNSAGPAHKQAEPADVPPVPARKSGLEMEREMESEMEREKEPVQQARVGAREPRPDHPPDIAPRPDRAGAPQIDDLPDPTADTGPTEIVEPAGSQPAAAREKPVHRPEDVPEDVWNDWIAVRKGKRAKVTQTAVRNIRIEADRAGMTLAEALEMSTAQGWQGFRADWAQRARASPNGRGALHHHPPKITPKGYYDGPAVSDL